MKNLLIILTILISSVGYSQSSDTLTTYTNPVFNEDSIIYYFIELVNEEKFRIGKVFEGNVKESYVRKPWQKKGKFVYDTLWGKYNYPQVLTIDSGLVNATNHHATYLKLMNENKDDDLIYITHMEDEDISGFEELPSIVDRAETYLSGDYFSEIIYGGYTTNYKIDDLNKRIATIIFEGFLSSKKGHKEIMVDPKNTKVGVDISSTFMNGSLIYFAVVNFI